MRDLKNQAGYWQGSIYQPPGKRPKNQAIFRKTWLQRTLDSLADALTLLVLATFVAFVLIVALLF